MSRFNEITAARSWAVAQKYIYAVEILATIVLLALLTFAKDAKAQSGNVYGYGQSQQVSSSVEEGVVLQVTSKTVQASFQTTALGTAVGGVVGGVLGASIDKSTRFGGAILGSTLGGLLGAKTSQNLGANNAQEVLVGLKAKTGEITRVVTLVQPAPFDAVSTGQRVLLSNINGTYRVLPQQYTLLAQ